MIIITITHIYGSARDVVVVVVDAVLSLSGIVCGYRYVLVSCRCYVMLNGNSTSEHLATSVRALSGSQAWPLAVW